MEGREKDGEELAADWPQTNLLYLQAHLSTPISWEFLKFVGRTHNE